MAIKNKIRFKLISNILILLFGAVISTGFMISKISEHELTKETKLKLLAINNSKATSIQTYLSESYRSIETIRKYRRNLNDYILHYNSNKKSEIEKVKAIREMFQEQLSIIQSEHNFHSVGIIQIDGSPLLSGRKFEMLNSKVSNTSEIYKQALSKTVFTNVYEIKRKNYLSIIAPIKHTTSDSDVRKNYKKTIALIVIEIDLEPIYRILYNNIGLGQDGESIIISKTKNTHTGELSYFFLSPPNALPELVGKKVDSKGTKAKAIELCFKNKNSDFINDELDYKGVNTFAAWQFIESLNWGIFTFVPTNSSTKMIKELNSIIKILILSILILTSFFVIIITSKYTNVLVNINEYLKKLNKGIKPKKIAYSSNNEIKEIIQEIEILTKRKNRYVRFSKNMAEGKLDITLKKSDQRTDTLAVNLINVRNSLNEINNENERRKWASKGFNLHGDIMMENADNLKALGQKLISSIVHYLGAHQGALFTLKKIKDDRFESDKSKLITVFELVASYAFNNEKAIKQNSFRLGQGLVGQSALEKKTVYLEDTPLVQTQINSGLGDAPASNLLIIPLKINEEVLGVLELAGFKKFKPFEIEFLEQLGESIASSLLTLISNEHTKEILKENEYVLTLMKEKEKEILENQSNLVDLLETLQQDYNTALQDIHKLKKENQEFRKRNY